MGRRGVGGIWRSGEREPPPIQRPYWDATTLLLLSFGIKVAMGTMAFILLESSAH